MFREAYRKRRCIVPMNSFFQKDATGRRYAISRRDGELFGVAGIWENWRDSLTSLWERTFTHPIGACVIGIFGGGAAAAFALLHGAGNGILTIARGTLPLAIFGPENYAYRLGLIGDSLSHLLSAGAARIRAADRTDGTRRGGGFVTLQSGRLSGVASALARGASRRRSRFASPLSLPPATVGAASSEIPRLHLDAVDVQVRHVDVSRLGALRRQAARVDAGTAVVEFVAAPMWQREAVIPITDAGEFGGQIGQMVCDEMDDFALALDAALHSDHARRQDNAPLAFIEGRPDHQVGDAGLVLDGDEHDALGGSRLLTHRDQAGGR
jgi:hypothetical protein